MRILMAISGDRAPSSRYRMLPYVRHFKAAGHQCVVAASFPQKYEWLPWLGFRPSQLLKRLVRYGHWWQSRWRRDEIVIIERELFDDPTVNFEKRFRMTTPGLVVDLDDAVFLRYPEKFDQLIEMADLVVCGNRNLQSWASQKNPHTVVIPSCVEFGSHPEKDWQGVERRPLRIGWIGTPSNLSHLAIIAPALRELTRFQEFEFRIVTSDSGPLDSIDLTGVRVNFVSWDSRKDVDQLREIDIGVMPLPTGDEWAKYKCGMKLIQYMAVGIPAVASPVGVNSEIVEHGNNGYLAGSSEDWFRYLGELLTNAELRRSLGSAGRERVRTDYSIESQAPRYLAALNALRR